MADKQMKTFNTGTTRYIITDAQAREDIAELQDQVAPLDVSAQSGDVGKALKAKTVANGKVTEYELGEAAIIDDTLSIAGEAADAKETGDAIAELDDAKVNKPATSPDGTSGQLLRTNGDGTTVWVDVGLPTDAQTADAVSAWLDDHPEATTTVQDGAITKAKLDSNLQGTVDDVDDLKSQIDELAVNGYYTDDSEQQDVYITLTSGGITSLGTIESNTKKGYIWLTSEQESLSLKFDTSNYSYSLCYIKNNTVAKFTAWLTASPIVFDDTEHDSIGITIKKNDNTVITNLLSAILYYTTGESQTIGNLATKNYAIAKQQSVADAGKILTVGNDGIVAPAAKDGTDDTLSVQGKAADAKATGDTIKELAEKGYIEESDTVYYQLTSGFINNPLTNPITNSIQSNSSNGYISIAKAQIPDGIYYDNTKYKVNTLFGKNGYMVSNTYTAWQTTSPVQYIEPSDYDALYINVRKLSGAFSEGELNQALYWSNTTAEGQLITREQLNAYTSPGGKRIYPDGFESRIMPAIYYNGRYYADIDIGSYKVGGTGEVWVALSGNDTTGDGTESNPYATITKALAQSAVTIKIKAGTYVQGTHYGTTAEFTGKNIIGVGSVILEDDASGHYTYTGGSAYFENITFKHGSTTTNAAFLATCTTSGQTACFVNCVFRDGGTNGLSATGIDVICVRCAAYGNKLDGFNYHDKTASNVTYVPNVLEIDCVAYNNGSSESGSDSCNGSTAHDGTKIIRLNGEYYACYGGVIAEIARTGDDDPATISVNYGVLAHDSTGTDTYKASFWASYNAHMYLYDCMSYGGDYDISAINDAKIVSWRLTSGRDNPSVNAASTATVIQH